MAASTAQLGNLSVTTKVVQAGENIPGLGTLPSTPNWVHVLSQKNKRPIKSLSAVIILIGALQLSIGVSMHVAEKGTRSLVSHSGIYWGSVAFISAGIMTVIFANEETVIKIKTCLISHGISATFAAIAIILYAIQVYTDTQACWVEINGEHSKCNSSTSSTNDPHDYDGGHHYGYWNYANYVRPLRVSLNSLILFYIIVGFVISITIIILEWKVLKAAKYKLLGS